ncbi:hypothetical protein CRENPOLYSF1_1340007 [Crenothrix polyspora]|uniref:Uncharacterized protein n=1 Tax=Crenothrix polyspora TaxID=360316 RepID=A0A1R4H216_9GAMM|nr:hypothetical protein CRENPOLYSF1_1340007 [Crenothrix polyspora]
MIDYQSCIAKIQIELDHVNRIDELYMLTLGFCKLRFIINLKLFCVCRNY